MSSTDNQSSAEFLIDQLANSGSSLTELLKEKEIKTGLIAHMRDLGVPCPGLVYFLILSAMSGSASFLGSAVSTRLQPFISKQPKLADILQSILNLKQGEKNKHDLRTALQKHLNLNCNVDLSLLNADESTSLDVLLALHNIKGFQHLIESLDRAEKMLLHGFQSELETLFQAMVEPTLSWPDEVINKNNLGAFDKLKYTAGIDEFYGREDDIDLLRRFVGDPSMGGKLNAFRWMLLIGEGGSGKTRLAYHFTRQVLDSTRWRSGRLVFSDIPAQEDVRKWRPRQPNFIVIDYAQTHPEKLGELMRVLSQNAKHYDFPVRLLLLERRAENIWTDKLLPNDSNRAMVLEHGFGTEPISGRLISPLQEADIAALMAGRFRRVNLVPPADSHLLAAARQIDKMYVPRPLFAVAAAEAMVVARQEGLPDITLDRETVLSGIIERERQLRWEQIKGIDEGELRQYEILLALATYVQGFDFDALHEVRSYDKSLELWLPEPAPKHKPALISAMGGDAKTLPPMEPDILGEFYLLKQLYSMSASGAALLAAGANINYPRAIITLLRLLQDFPDSFPHQLLIDAMSNANTKEAAEAIALISPNYVSNVVGAEDFQYLPQYFNSLELAGDRFKSLIIAVEEAKAAVNITNYAGRLGDWSRVDAILARLDVLRQSFPSNEDIGLEEAKAAVNVTNYVGTTGDRPRVDAMLRRLDAVRQSFPDNEDIWLTNAKAMVNVTNYAGKVGDWSQIDVILTGLNRLRQSSPNNEGIGLQEAKAAVNVTNYAGTADDWSRVDAMLTRLDVLKQNYPRNEDIGLEDARAVVNVTNCAGKAGDWSKVDAMLTRMDVLRQSFPDQEGIGLMEAKAAVNVTNYAGTRGDWSRVDAMLKRLDALKQSSPDNEDIGFEDAKAAFNVTKSAGEAGDWLRVDIMLKRFDVLRQSFPDNKDIGLLEANAAVNITNYAGTAGDWSRVDAMMTRLDILREHSPYNEVIGLQEAKVATNVTSDASAVGDWSRVDAMLTRLNVLRESFPDNEGIGVEEAKAAVNVTKHASTAGDWLRVESMLARLEALVLIYGPDKVIYEDELRIISLFDARSFAKQTMSRKKRGQD